MRRSCRIAAAAALVAVTAATPATKPAAVRRPTTAFTNEEFGFKLKYPADWLRPERPESPAALTLWMPVGAGPATRPTDGRVKGVRVGGVELRVSHAEREAAGKPDANILRDLTGLMAANLFADLDLGAKHVAIKPAKVGDLAACRQVRFVVQPPAGQQVTVSYVVAVRKGTEYVFTVAAPTADFDRLWPDVAAMLASFEVRE